MNVQKNYSNNIDYWLLKYRIYTKVIVIPIFLIISNTFTQSLLPEIPIVNNNDNTSNHENVNLQDDVLKSYDILSYFKSAAQSKGFSADSNEIKLYAREYELLSPEIKIPGFILHDQIIVQKYLEAQFGILYTKADIERQYKNYTENLKGLLIPSISDIESILKFKAIISCDYVQTEFKRIKDTLAQQEMDHFKKALEPWSASELKIDAPEGEWIAKHADSTNILLTVKTFNERIEFEKIPKGILLDSSRIFIVNNMLTDLFAFSEAYRTGLNDTNEVEKQKTNLVNSFFDRERYGSMFDRVSDETTLWRIYGDYFDILFRKQSIKYISLLGSSDSAYIITVRNVLKTSNGAKFSRTIDSLGKTIPWKHFVFDNLPDNLKCIADTLHENRISQIVPTNYGYFLLKADSTMVIHEASFENVKEQLIYLATKLKYENFKSILEQTALKQYNNIKSLNTTPDTFTIKSRLFPNESESIKYVKQDSKNQRNTINEPLVKSIYIPLEMQNVLKEKYLCNSKNEFFGPIETSYGIWFFQIIDYKSGSIKIPFQKIKKQIVDSLIKNEISNKFIINSKRAQAYDSIALARVYMDFLLGRGKNRNNKFPNEDMKKKQYTQTNELLKKWMSKIFINTEIINRKKINLE